MECSLCTVIIQFEFMALSKLIIMYSYLSDITTCLVSLLVMVKAKLIECSLCTVIYQISLHVPVI